MGEHDQVTPHLARSARHPLPKGEGCASDFGSLCPAADMGKDQKCRNCTCFRQHLEAKLGSLITD
jgi:hypothetical protein